MVSGRLVALGAGRMQQARQREGESLWHVHAEIHIGEAKAEELELSGARIARCLRPMLLSVCAAGARVFRL